MRARTGSIDTTRDGRHRVRLTLPNKERRTLGIFDSIEEAETQRAAALSVMDTEGLNDGWTVNAWGERWLTAREVGKVVRDPQSDWGRFNVHIKPDPIGKMALRVLRRRHVREWLKRVRRKVARQTALNTLNVMRGMLGAAVEDEILKVNPAAGLRLPREKRTEEPWTYATPPEQVALVNAIEGPERFIVAFAIGTGLRAGEICTLRLVDVHVKGPNPHVVVRYGSVPNLPTKTGRIRKVPLFGVGLSAALAWLDALPSFAKKNPHGLMFPRKRGGYRDERHILRWETWIGAKETAGITRDFRFHDLRHTAASSLVSGWWERQWSLTEVRDFLGHESVTTTERYAHLAGTALEKAAEETRCGLNRPRSSQGREMTEKSGDFLNRGSQVRIPPRTPPGKQAPDSVREATDRGQLEAVSRAFLRAVAAEDALAADAYRAQFGSLYVADMTRAIELAEAVLAVSGDERREVAS